MCIRRRDILRVVGTHSDGHIVKRWDLPDEDGGGGRGRFWCTSTVFPTRQGWWGLGVLRFRARDILHVGGRGAGHWRAPIRRGMAATVRRVFARISNARLRVGLQFGILLGCLLGRGRGHCRSRSARGPDYTVGQRRSTNIEELGHPITGGWGGVSPLLFVEGGRPRSAPHPQRDSPGVGRGDLANPTPRGNRDVGRAGAARAIIPYSALGHFLPRAGA